MFSTIPTKLKRDAGPWTLRKLRTSAVARTRSLQDRRIRFGWHMDPPSSLRRIPRSRCWLRNSFLTPSTSLCSFGSPSTGLPPATPIALTPTGTHGLVCPPLVIVNRRPTCLAAKSVKSPPAISSPFALCQETSSPRPEDSPRWVGLCTTSPLRRYPASHLLLR